LVPYNDEYRRLASRLKSDFGIDVFADPDLFAALEAYSLSITGRVCPAYRKFAFWFGPFDQFVYFDTDVVVFQDQIDVFSLLDDHDIVFCGDGRVMGIREVFTERVLDRQLFSSSEIDDLFNTGFFASRKDSLSRDQLFALLAEAAEVRDIFVPYLQDQPVLNYVALKAFRRRANLRLLSPAIPGDAWAGLSTLRVDGDRVVDSEAMPIRNLHWAGFHRIPERPYVRVWLSYRYPGRWRAPQRLAIRVGWLVQKVARRTLCTHLPDWYKPAFQVKRVRRIWAQRIAEPLRRIWTAKDRAA